MTSSVAASLHHTSRTARTVAVLLTCTCLAIAARADTNTSMGNRSGDGANPFTGLAKAPEANLFTGALNTSISIEIPPGRKNATPKLALEYSSSGGPSSFGYAWDLPIGRIEHATKWGVPRCDDAHFDDYVLTMSGTSAELINDPPGSNVYRPKAEEAYVKAELDTASNSWVVYDRAGMRYEFGKSAYSRIGTNSAAFTHLEADGTCTFTSGWALTKMRDPNGNTVEISWFALWNQLLPLSVEYGGNETLGTSHLYLISFFYESRPDTVISYRQGAPIKLLFRLNQIDVSTYIPSYQSVRSYDLYYDDAQPTRQSLLVAVTKTGLPTQAFTYTPVVTGHRAMCPDAAHCTLFAGPRNFLRSYTRTEGDVSNTLLDMNGDGILDYVSWNDGGPTWTVNFGQFGAGGSFGFAPPTPWGRIFGYGDPIRNVVLDCDAAGGGICTKTDTIDITGDGVPDFVVGDSSTTWRVYPGRLTPTGNWGFAATEADGAILNWTTPQKWLRRVRIPAVNPEADNQSIGSTVIQDLVDMNGDGLIDLVVAGISPWLVYLNNGRGFDPTPVSFRTSVGIAAPIAHNNTAFQYSGLMDFNGDGLPDMLWYNIMEQPDQIDSWCRMSNDPEPKLHDCLLVFFNNGAGFDDFEVNEVPSGSGYSREQDGQYYRELLDINGDGLPDLIDRPLVDPVHSTIHSDEWHVQLNVGGKLEPLSYYHSGGNWLGAIPRVWPGLSGPIRQRNGQYDLTDMVDIDGDGFLDRVATNSSTGWSVWLNRAGAYSINGGGPSQHPNLLATMTNGFGGTNTIVYRPSTAYDNTGGVGSAPDLPFPVWLVERTCRSDGMCAAGGDLFDPATNSCIAQGHDMVTKYRYRDGRFDPPSREFRGFRRVEQITEEAHLDDNQAPVDDVDTTFATEFEQLDTTKGRILGEAWYGGAECIGSQPEPDCRPPEIIRLSANLWSSTAIGMAGRSQVWLAESFIWSFDPVGSNYKLYVDNQPPDAYGNILESKKRNGSNQILVTAHTDYAVPQGGGTPIYSRPSHSWTSDPHGLLQEQWFYYDGLQNNGVAAGNVTKVESRLDATTSATISASTTYDGFGNILVVTDANGNSTTTSYDSYHLHPVQIGNALNHATDILSRDYRFGEPTAVRDPNGAVRRTTYDVAGRKQCEARPGEDIALCPIRYEYHFAGPAETLSYIKVSETQPSRSSSGCGPRVPRPPLSHTESFDALGRPRHMDKFQVVDGAAATIRTDETVYDAAGRISRVFQPHLANTTAAWMDAERYDYHLEDAYAQFVDPLGRAHLHTHPDGKSRRTVFAGDETRHFDEENNLTIDVRDALGRTVKSIDFVRQNGSQQVYSVDASIQYTYDGLGRLLEVRQNDSASALRTMTYDLLGRRLTLVDLDSGLWRYAYDAVGNLIAEDDPKPNQQTQTCYDKLNRPVRRCVWNDDAPQTHSCTSACPAANVSEQVTYAYDGDDGWSVAYAKGRLTRIIDGSGQFDVVAYDVRGRQTQTKKTISAIGGAHQATFTYAYDTNDRLTAVTYPDGELVTTDYDDSGQPQALYSGAYNYVLSAEYDLYGRLTELEHGNHVVDRRTYGSATQGHRLATLTSAPAAGGAALLSLSYPAYDGRGFIKQIDDQIVASGDHTNSARFTYDARGRLTAVDSNYDGFDRAYAYDTFGNITRNGSIFFDYAPAKHQVTALRSGGPTGAVVGTVQHDENGSRTQTATEYYTYNKSGRVQTITVGGAQSSFYYDFRGRKVVRVIDESIDVVTRYYSELAETTNGTLTKWYFLGGQRVAADNGNTGWETAMAPSNGSVWLAGARMEHPALVMVLTRGVASATGAGIAIVGTVLLLAPWRPRSPLGRRVRYGHLIGLVVLWNVATLPWPFVIAPEEVSAQPGTGRVHYHLDHLGSTQVVSGPTGTVVEEIRYSPYGEIRGRWGANGENTGLYEFTGYESERDSALQYAGARFYDPFLGSFLTHDPVENFINPYSYVHWNPTNGVDPDGACELVCGIIAAVLLIGALVTPAVQAGLNGANAGEAIEASVTGLVIGVAVQATVIGPLAHALGSAAPAVYAAQIAYGAYSTYEGFRSGQYVAAGFGALELAYGLYAAFAEPANEYEGRLSQRQQLEINKREFDQRFEHATYFGRLVKGEAYEVLGAIVGPLYGIATGTYGIAKGVISSDFSQLSNGFRDILSALSMPRSGSHSGLGWPGTSENRGILPETGTKLNNASMWHDDITGRYGFGSAAQFGWVVRAWAGPGVEMGLYGQAYRLMGTAGFGLAGSVQAITGF